MDQDEGLTALDNIVTQFNTYEDFLDSQITSVDLYYLEVTEEADKQKGIRLQSAENLNDSWVHASEGQIQSVVHASENGNHSAIHVSENLNPSLAYTSANESQIEVPGNLMISVVHEAEKPNHSAAALVLKKQNGKMEEHPVLVENREDDGLKHDNLNIKVESEHPTEDSEQLQVILDGTSLVSQDSFIPLILTRMKNNDNLVKFLEDQTEKIKELDELDRSSKKTSNEKEEVKERGNHMFDLNKLLSSEGKVETCEILSCDTVLELIEQLMRQNKDSDSLVKIWCAVCSHKRSMELQKQRYELITGIEKSLQNEIIALQKEKFQVDIENTNLQAELQRLTAENLELEAELMLQEKKDEQLSKFPSEKLIEEQAKLNESLTQSLAEVKRSNRELKKKIYNRFKILCTMMDKDSDAHKNRDFSHHNFSSTTRCEEDMVFKLREELESIEIKILQEEIQRQCLEDENNLLEQELADANHLQEECEILEGTIKQLEEKILSLKTHMDKNMVERSEVEKSKKVIEEKYRSQLLEKINQVNQFLQEDAASNQQIEQSKQEYILLMEDKLKNIETEMVEVKLETISLNKAMRLYKKKYRAELKTEESLKYKLENLEEAWKLFTVDQTKRT